MKHPLIVSSLYLGVLTFFTQGRAYGVQVTIDTMDVNTFGHYSINYNPQSGLDALGQADVYHLSNGTQWHSGAGTVDTYFSPFDHEVTQGNTASYFLQPPSGGVIFQQTDYDNGSHSAQGTLGVAGPLRVDATIGSKIAVMSGYVRILSNSPANYPPPLFNYYSAPVGAVVPFTVTYTLQSGTWQANTFQTAFMFNLAGTVNFAATPELSGAVPAVGILLIGGMLLARRQRDRRQQWSV